MTGYGHYSSEYMKLLYSIQAAGSVPCESYPEIFFPEDIPEPDIRRQLTIIAKEMCSDCPVKIQCFEYALETDQRHGIWGGTSPDER